MYENFQIYVVGGYVRDLILNQQSKDMDFVVVGATEQELIEFGEKYRFGFKKVGADFPVYLDHFGREWALARKERKVGHGYHGFECDFDPTVTLEEDLLRRDLTMNAMAMQVVDLAHDGYVSLSQLIVDPYNGQHDLKSCVIKHVSSHFSEDPVRVLRLARFTARYGFTVHAATATIVWYMHRDGELEYLVPERVWSETEKAVQETLPGIYFQTLIDLGVCEAIYPGLEDVWTQEKRRALDVADNVEQAIAILFLGGSSGEFPVPTKVASFAKKFNWLYTSLDVNINVSRNVMLTFDQLDVYRDKEFLDNAVKTLCCFPKGGNSYSAQSRLGIDRISRAMGLSKLYNLSRVVGYDDLTDEQKESLSGPEIGQAIKTLRKEVITEALAS